MAAGATAQTLLSDNFDDAQPGAAYTGTIRGSSFSVLTGNADIIGNILNGAAAAYFSCPSGSAADNNCLDLNGTIQGAVGSNAGFNLTAGITYTLAFSAAGSVADSNDDPYTFTVSLGDSGSTRYVVPAGGSFQAERFTYTPSVSQSGAQLVLASTTDLPGDEQYGPLIDNVVLSANAEPSPALTQFYESFDGTMPGSNISSAIAGSQFTVYSGNVDVLGTILNGASSAFYSCPTGLPEPSNCIDLNGDQPGAIETATPFALTAGTTYQVSFLLAGNVADGTHTSYSLAAVLGDSGDIDFSVLPGTGFTPESFLYTPSTGEPSSELQFISQSLEGDTQYGPIIADVSVSILPEPGSAAIMIAALAVLGRVRRPR